MIPYYEENLRRIVDSFASMDVEVYEDLLADCLNALNKGGSLIASGLGKNVPICEKFVGTMNSFGMNAKFLHTNTAIHGDLGMVKKGDVVFFLSKSGNTQETLALLNYMKRKDCVIWAMTFHPDSKLCAGTEKQLVLSLEHEGDEWDLVPNNSTSIYLILLQGIAIELSKRLHITPAQFGVNHPGGNIGEVLRSK